MNLQRVQYYLIFCESLHFTNAARQLGISQPALTKAISKLEQDLSTKLIRREGKHTHLTNHGSLVRQKFSRLMQQVQATEIDLDNAVNGKEENLRIAIVTTLDFTRFAEFLAFFHKHCPQVSIDIVDCSIRESEEMLLNGEVDCVLTPDAGQLLSRAICIELYTVKMAQAHPSGNKPPRSAITKLASQVLPENDVGTQIFDDISGNSRPVIQCSQQLWAQQLIKAGLGCCLLPDGSELIDGVRLTTHSNETPVRTIFAAVPIGRSDSSAFNSFVKLLKTHRWS